MTFQIPFEERILGNILIDSAKKFGPKPFLTIDGRCYSFTEAHDISQSVARGLKGLGVVAGEPVMLMLDNSAEFIFAWFGIALLSATCVPVNTAYTGDLLAYVAGDVQARIAITSDNLAPAFAALPAECRGALATLVVSGNCEAIEGLDTIGWDAFKIPEGELITTPAKPSDMAFICYTSGTTGPSKGVMMSHSQVLQTTENFINVTGMRPDDTVFSPLPLFHGMSRSMATLPALVLGAQVHLAARFSATKFWQQVREAEATISMTIFTIPPVLKSKPPSADDRAHKVRVMFNAHHDPEFEERFGVRLVEAHAMTETGMTIFTPFPERKLGASGRAGPDWDTALVDENDDPVPPGEIGELVLRPRKRGILMDGYLNKPETTLGALRNLWFHTGDLMRADEDGYYFFAGRKKERIRRRGENISAYEVEAIAAEHPEVVECAVVGVPAGDNEDDVYLCGVLRSSKAVSPEALHAWLQERLPKFMVPRYIEFRDELPKTPSAKVEKHTLMKTLPAATAWDSLRAHEPV